MEEELASHRAHGFNNMKERFALIARHVNVRMGWAEGSTSFKDGPSCKQKFDKISKGANKHETVSFVYTCGNAFSIHSFTPL